MESLYQTLEKEITKLTFPKTPRNLYEPIQYVLSMGGKRLRPILVLLGYGLKKENCSEAIIPSLTVEIFHNFTLIHDDIMDQAPLRRGHPTVHEKWNNTVAILSGDTMMVKAYDQLLHTPIDRIPQSIRKFNACVIRVCEGQQMDMNFEKLKVISENQYIEMIRLKTATLLGFCLEYGGILADMEEQELKKLYDIGETAGIGFQLMDDLLDVYGDKTKFGKQVGGDIVSNKKTYLLIKALELANQSQKKEIEKWLSTSYSNADGKVGAIKKIYSELNIFELTQNKMNSYYDRSFTLINQLKCREKGKTELIHFLEKLMRREC